LVQRAGGHWNSENITLCHVLIAKLEPTSFFLRSKRAIPSLLISMLMAVYPFAPHQKRPDDAGQRHQPQQSVSAPLPASLTAAHPYPTLAEWLAAPAGNQEVGVVVEVAKRAGFGDDERMRRAFMRHLGVSPSEYRRRFSG
jgi:AraC-like DNA-binding protein